MRRRNFLKGIAGVVAVAAIPITVKASSNAVDWQQVDNNNPFSQDDTVYERLEKFNQLTGLGVSFGFINLRGEFVRDNKFYGATTCGRTCLVFNDGSGTGYMNREEFLHWTAEVGLGYRIAKAQGL